MPDEAEQAAIARPKRLRDRGKSLRYIAGKLALDGYKLNPESVRRVFGTVAHTKGGRACRESVSSFGILLVRHSGPRSAKLRASRHIIHTQKCDKQ